MTSLPLATPPPAFSLVNALFPRIMLAIDFGSASLGAARWATTHVVQGGEAVLMHVVPCEDDLRCADGRYYTEHESVRDVTPGLTGGLGGFAATLDVATATSLVRSGQPSRCLALAIKRTRTSLLVLGRRAASNRIRIGEPNVIERVARRTSASVLVIPEGTTLAPRHVVAAVDTSSFAATVLHVASRLAALHEVPLSVLHVHSPVAGAYERVIRTAKQLLAPGKDRAARRTSNAMLPASLSLRKRRWLVELGQAHAGIGREAIEVVIGDAAREIAQTAAERDAALLVIGTRGADEAPEGSLGSVARELLTRAPVPVLAVNGA